MFKRLLLILVPFLVGMSIVGVMDEMRIYGEIIPLITASALAALYVVFFRLETAVFDKPARHPAQMNSEQMNSE